MPKKRRQPLLDKPEPRPPATPCEIAAAAFGMAILQAHEDGGGGDVAAGDAAVYEMLALLCLEGLALLYGHDPAGFGYLLNGLAIHARMRSAERMHAARAGVPPSPLSKLFEPARVH